MKLYFLLSLFSSLAVAQSSAGVPVARGGEVANQRSAVEPEPPSAKNSTAPKGDTIRYNVNWPSGLSLGEAQLTSSLKDGQWSLAFNLDAAVPGFALREAATSTATNEYCSLELKKNATRGNRIVDETTEFDQKSLTATRRTNKGGKSEIKITSCAKDALAFLFFMRRELIAGRLPQVQDVYYGAAYRVRVQYAGVQVLRIGGEAQEADRVVMNVKGPASDLTVDLYFSRDAARTPLKIETPLAMGKFSMEIAR